jgi:hypothetical protein
MHVTLGMCVLYATLCVLYADAQLCNGTYGNVTRCPSLNGVPTMKSTAEIADFVSKISDHRIDFQAQVAQGLQVNTSRCFETSALVGCYSGSQVCDRETGQLVSCSVLCVEMLRCMPTPPPDAVCADVSAKPNDLCWGRGGVQREPALSPPPPPPLQILSGSSMPRAVRPGYAVFVCAWLAAAVAGR